MDNRYTSARGGQPPQTKKKHIALRVVVIVLVLLLAASAGTGIAFAVWAIRTAPELSDVNVSPHGYRTAVLDDAGQEILTLAGEASNRVYVRMEEIPMNLSNAFIAIEDARFYKHHGVDLRGIARALFKNLTSGSLSQGASTITQQLIKNNVFSAGMNENTAMEKIRRKIQEQYLALMLEREKSKNWILENYLNTINLGGGTWGVQTAARRYFGKEVSELTLPECACIAGITKSPTAYNPLRNPDKNRERQLLVLACMRDQGMITEEECLAASAVDIYSDMKENAIPNDIRPFTWFEDAVVSQVAEDLQDRLGYSESEAWTALYRGGLTIKTTQDTAIQRACEREVNGADLEQQMTAVVLDFNTGAVKGIVGGRGEKNASLAWNRAISSPRQPGSTIKVVAEYAAALETGTATLATTYDDALTYYSNGTSIRNAGGSYDGLTSVRSAIASSRNTVALRCFQAVGLDGVWQQVQRYGFAHLDEEDKVEALALGGTHHGVTNLELTAAYASIASGGLYFEPHFYTQVLNREGVVLMANNPQGRVTMSPATAELLTSAMQDVLKSGTGTSAAFSGMSLAGKSGTTTDRRDLWFVGFSPYYACGVWSGYDDGNREQSGTPVQPVWREIMRAANADLPDAGFPRPVALKTATICTKCGNLAVSGLCDETVQGNMTRTELFDPDGVPTKSCTCHVRVELCEVTHQRAGLYCRNRYSRVYLREGTSGTADAPYVMPSESDRCSAHTRWTDWLLPEEREEREREEEYGYQGEPDSREETSGDTESPETGGEEAASTDAGLGGWDWLFPGTSEPSEPDTPTLPEERRTEDGRIIPIDPEDEHLYQNPTPAAENPSPPAETEESPGGDGAPSGTDADRPDWWDWIDWDGLAELF